MRAEPHPCSTTTASNSLCRQQSQCSPTLPHAHTMEDEGMPDENFLSGAELYDQLAAQTSEQLQSTEAKQRSYTALAETLQLLTGRRRHAVLAPVGNGLAYFDAELCHTNEVLVLLGDNWFAERTVPQAISICHRRLAYLDNEQRRLSLEHADLKKRLAFFEAEFGGGDGVVAAKNASEAPASAGASVSAAAEHGENTGDDGFVSEDELTDAELQMLEDAIAATGRLGDDPYVEQCMLDLMLEKRAARLHREGLVFGRDTDAATGDTACVPVACGDATTATGATAAHCGKASCGAAELAATPSVRIEASASGGRPVFQSPADIGKGINLDGYPTEAACDERSDADDATPPTCTPNGGKRSVSFAPLPSGSGRQCDAPCTNSATLTTRRRDAGAGGASAPTLDDGGDWTCDDDCNEFVDPYASHVAAKARHNSDASAVPKASADPPPPSRVPAAATRYDPLGEVVERSAILGTNRGQQPGSAPAAAGSATKHTTTGRSLFMQRMLGEGR